MLRWRWIALSVLLWATGCGGAAAAAQSGAEPLAPRVCQLIEQAARDNDLPIGFVTRIIRSESGFRSAAVSPAGAEGIAQFMPHTAAQQGLADPFDPEQAIPKAAQLLAELRRQFGNLGMAAAAYNAGTSRLALWMRGEGQLPAETRVYVRLVTARSGEDWQGSSGGAVVSEQEACLSIAAEQRHEVREAHAAAGGLASAAGIRSPLRA